MVAPNGAASMNPAPLLRPNGCALSQSGTHFVVAETRVHRVTVLDLVDHRLVNPRPMGVLPSGTWADGMCLDAQDHAWVADPKGGHCFRLSPDGSVVAVIDTSPYRCVACVLGGPERTTLFLTLAEDLKPFGRDDGVLSSRVDAVTVPVPGGGVP